jgi:hypothetical protein
MRTLQFNHHNEIGAVPVASLINAGTSLVSSIVGSSSAKKVAASQASIAASQSKVADAQARLAQSTQSFELSKLETERKARTQTLLIVGGLLVVVTGVGVAVYLSSKNDKAAKAIK